MDDTHRREFQALLDDREAEAHRRLADADAALAEVSEARGDGVADDEHDPEGVPLSAEWTMVRSRQQDTIAELAAIAAARVRMDAGEYGVCIDCGRAIPVARLRARPFATRCVACEERAH
ncbi:TraR/DksA family transcriptional regulator [Microbacterium gorillae]|uniref:TraR/DksA family transcriptional regulator n=1 Tax=Microbacterium gorillae TaxID=1231063 RepID=UPI0006944CA2|nr:TraR/DksA C4-type zinc finger protein [Microbacterium gorillae]